MPENLDQLRLLTPRLRLRAATDDDVDFVLDMYSRPEVTQYLGTRDWTETTEAQALQRIRGYRAHFTDSTGVWLIETRDFRRRLGFVLLKPIPFSAGVQETEQDLEIGWHLHPDAQGCGYAAEAAAALIDHAGRAGITTLVAVTDAANSASRAVARRLGMTHQGSTDRYYDATCELYTLTVSERSVAPPPSH